MGVSVIPENIANPAKSKYPRGNIFCQACTEKDIISNTPNIMSVTKGFRNTAGKANKRYIPSHTPTEERRRDNPKKKNTLFINTLRFATFCTKIRSIVIRVSK